MDQSAIADRRQLRRKLTFWRVAAVLIALAAVFAAVAWRWPGETGDHIARVSISGIIQDDSELLARLDAIAQNERAKALVVTIASPGGTTEAGLKALATEGLDTAVKAAVAAAKARAQELSR